MNNNNKSNLNISHLLLKVAYNFFELDNKSEFYGTDVQLFPAEIHMITAIKEHEGIHVTGLAKLLNITKGAVSQVVIKLEQKELICKEKDITNQSRLILKLTSKGEIAYKNHCDFHRKIDNDILELLKNNSKNEKEFLTNFLQLLDKKITTFIK